MLMRAAWPFLCCSRSAPSPPACIFWFCKSVWSALSWRLVFLQLPGWSSRLYSCCLGLWLCSVSAWHSGGGGGGALTRPSIGEMSADVLQTWSQPALFIQPLPLFDRANPESEIAHGLLRRCRLGGPQN